MRAIESVRSQTFQDFEIVVTVDGRDNATVKSVRKLSDPRIRAFVPDANLGNAEARNVAIQAAEGELIALLDDDDIWMPGKLAAQVETYDRIGSDRAIVSCFFRVQSESERLVWPRRRPGEGEPLSEFIFCRHRSLSVEGAVQTSTLLAARALFLSVPFDKDLPRMVDLDWLLRVAGEGAFLVFPDTEECLSLYAVDDTRPRVSHKARWSWERDWAIARRELFTDRSFAAFLLTSASLAASRAGDHGAFIPLLKTALREGRPSAAEIAFHCGNTALPLPLKKRIAAWLEPRKASA
ncbi:glycosyl transferase [Parvularcula lutaonensis]|nr:glycosyl transferase [Parvularcula lutaonensis]